MVEYISFPPGPFGPYSTAVKANGFIFVSGQIPVDERGEVISESIYEQTKRALILLYNAAGWPEEKVSCVAVRVYTTELGEAAEINRAYAEFHEENKLSLPARELVGVSALPKGAKIEIAGIFSE